MLGHHAVLGWSAPKIAVGIAFWGGVIVFCAFLGWASWCWRMLKNRKWQDGGIYAESKKQRWHEDERAVLYLALIAAFGLGVALLSAYFWTRT